ncbi:hypothetical protein [Litchfieldia salsa]|uniref:Uncharacterized protein n=1 Tax=Litchfieldia salsa TaxID=930152 RepID=A0A1H0X0K4_9BACI|nr:hypothetical protein [Litchfieldia salsa]SDP96379.1 hypothetical protein SAMN05216565_12133 [Litchfieldia salsa]
MNNENNVLWGAFFGFVLGLLVSKVYLSWAILYRTEGTVYSGENGWRDGILSTPLWVRATDHPLGFTIGVITIFILIGILFIRYLSNNTKDKNPDI